MPERQLQIHATPGLWPLSWPMGLTMLRLLLLPVFLWVLLTGARPGGDAGPQRWWAVGIFAVMAITDKLDGYLARKLNQVSKIGTILDPVADKLLIASSVVLLSFDWIAPPGFAIPMPVVVAVYGKDLVVAIGALLLLYLVGTVKIRPRPFGKLSTVLQLALVMLTLLAPEFEAFIGEGTGRPVLRGLWWAVCIVAALASIDYVRQGVRQFREARAAPKTGT